ncbi:MAG TPA: 16S rRNA (cytidine(1402)-2'-O)-methyltransferase [Atribacterota bacterium]|nr:16S rRNA (cytidine(1402)-2'-O)-methyltransferase [Atribacterota bacterium]
MDNRQSGILYICGTPIGNLSDITLRCLETLKKVDLIAAEDTRHTRILLNHYDIKKPVTSYHDFTTQKKTDYILQKLKEGQDIALLSDAGMPGLCDPGYEIINRALENNITLVPIPGVSALTTALVISGFPMQNFVFEGFIPRKKGEKEQFFTRLKEEPRTLIFYETPHRIKETLYTIRKVMGERKIVLARELTKIFEEIIRGKLSEVIEYINSKEVKGEITLVLEGNSARGDSSIIDNIDFRIESELVEKITNYLKMGYYNKDIVSLITEEYHITKKWVYEKIIELKKTLLK